MDVGCCMRVSLLPTTLTQHAPIFFLSTQDRSDFDSTESKSLFSLMLRLFQATLLISALLNGDSNEREIIGNVKDAN